MYKHTVYIIHRFDEKFIQNFVNIMCKIEKIRFSAVGECACEKEKEKRKKDDGT